MSALRTPLPTRERSYRFALTPLADALFQLLIFFMLSSSLTPYSLLTLRTGSALKKETTAAQTPGIPPPSGPPPTHATSSGLVWILREGQLESGGQFFEPTQWGELANVLAQQSLERQLTLVLSESARIQDVATALAALRQAQISDVRIAQERTR